MPSFPMAIRRIAESIGIFRLLTTRIPMMSVKWLVASICILVGVAEISAAAASSKSRLWSEMQAIKPGSRFTVALALRHPPGWHSYYKNSGGVEIPLSIQWALPEGFRAGEIQWPVPKVKDGYFGKSFIYPADPVFLVDIQAPDSLPPGDVTLVAEASWQICQESCLNEDARLELTLQQGPALVPNPDAAELFTRARNALPRKQDGLEGSAEISGDFILLRLTGPGISADSVSDFIPDQAYVASIGAGGSVEQTQDGLLLRLKRVSTDALENEIPMGNQVSGILLAKEPILVPAVTLDAAQAPAARTSPASAASSGLAGVFLGMFLGGLILNLMPCVFPVIGLKIMGFVQQAGSARGKVVAHGVIFTVGVLLSFAVLSGFLFAFKSSWGFQLQNPWIVFSLMVLMLVLALNMAGVFEIGASATSVGGSLQTRHGLAGSFFSGVLATVVATPCSAPFLGTAMAAAVSLPAIPFFTAFGAMAIGLSMPYLLLSIFPHWISRLPRPGPWMESFKQAMSFLLFATTGYLLWVYISQIDLENSLSAIFGLCAFAVAVWIHGRWNLPIRSRRTRVFAVLFSIAFAIGGFLLAHPPHVDDAGQQTRSAAIDWQAWSPEVVDKHLSEGRPVYIDFTATWCATCQVNKKRAYTGEVVDMMKAKQVIALRADKTKPDPRIDLALQQLGRTAIPVNVLLAPGRDPLILPEFLSPGDVLAALKSLDSPAKPAPSE